MKGKSHLPVVRWILKLLSQGLDPVIKILEELPEDKPLLSARERYWIAQNGGPIHIPGSRLLNCTEGGEGHGNCTPELKAKMAERMRGLAARIHTGRKHTPEHIQKNREAQTGRHHPENEIEKMSLASRTRKGVVDSEGVTYRSIVHAAKSNGVNQGTISGSICSGRKSKKLDKTFFLINPDDTCKSPGWDPTLNKRRNFSREKRRKGK